MLFVVNLQQLGFDVGRLVVGGTPRAECLIGRLVEACLRIDSLLSRRGVAPTVGGFGVGGTARAECGGGCTYGL